MNLIETDSMAFEGRQSILGDHPDDGIFIGYARNPEELDPEERASLTINYDKPGVLPIRGESVGLPTVNGRHRVYLAMSVAKTLQSALIRSGKMAAPWLLSLGD